MKKSFILVLLTFTLVFTGCTVGVVDNLHSDRDDLPAYDNIISQEVVIGDELIYGSEFSFENVYEAILGEIDNTARSVNSSRSAYSDENYFELTEDDIIEMVYFSVQPSSVDSLKLINEKMGFLNPVELDKDIIQACDPDMLIFKTTEIDDTKNIENYVNFETKYYYIIAKDVADEMSLILENFSVIEDFEMISETAIQRISDVCHEYSEEYDYDSRGIFANIWGGIKKAAKTVANAVSTISKTVVDFIIKPYEISGTLKYTYNNQTLPAYGINVKNVTIGGNNYVTNIDGKFNLGSRTDSAGLCFIWLDYENEACKLTNFLGVTASTLVKTALPSYLQNVTITSSSDYANAKMAICSDMYSRYNDESKRHSNIPQAVVWTTELGNGTSSAPTFHYRGANLLPDIILTGVTASSEKYAIGKLQTLHHEYTHFLHCVYTKNKNNFWDNVVESEFNMTIESIKNMILSLDFDFSKVNIYDFSNPYVNFTENLAEWYSLVGCYKKGMVGTKLYPEYGNGTSCSDSVFKNQVLFNYIVMSLTNDKKYSEFSDEIITLIDKDNITTFDELYASLIRQYPSKKTIIRFIFENNYIVYGGQAGNIINY